MGQVGPLIRHSSSDGLCRRAGQNLDQTDWDSVLGRSEITLTSSYPPVIYHILVAAFLGSDI